MGLFKRGQTWWMRFSYKGRQIRKSTETDNKKLAERIYKKIMGQVAEGKWFEKPLGADKTFKEMMEKYKTEHASQKASKKSFEGYANNLIDRLGDLLITEITPKVVNEYKVKRRKDGVKPATINRELATMKKAFNLAIREWEWVRDNPVSKVSMEKENNKRDRWLSYEEEEKLLKASPNWLQELIIFGVNTGMRLSEILSLSWKDVDLDRNTAIVMESKNREKRTIPFNQAALTLLKAKSKVRSIKTDLVFYSHAHTLIDKCNVGKVFRKVIKKAKIENLRFHDLRHTFATRLVQAGQDLYRVQLLLGHKTPFMTQRYAHHYPESLRSSVAALDTARKEFSTKLAQNKKVGANHGG